MNKAFKGAVVGAAGVALLAGGFGTFATWTDTEKIDAGVVKSGEMLIEAGKPTWSVPASAGGSTSISSTTSEQVMVPGDKIVMTQPLDVSVKGGIAKAKLTVDGFGWTSGSNYDKGLKITVNYAGQTYTLADQNPVLTWDDEDEMGQLLDAKAATVTFEYQDLPAGNTQSGWALDLQKTTLTLHQVN
jgi:alternate signal-mediated exported protein